MARSDDPPAAPAAIPDRRVRIGLVAGIAITAVAIAVAVAFGISREGDPGRVVAAVAAAQDGEIEGPPPADPGSGGGGFPAFATAAGWAPVGARSDAVAGRTVTTVFWGRQGRRVAESALPGDPASPPPGARRTGRRGVLLYSFDAGPRTAVTWTVGGRSYVISAIGVPRHDLYELAGGPPLRP
jgi:hypothetical protein